jgi:hypothetical protein
LRHAVTKSNARIASIHGVAVIGGTYAIDFNLFISDKESWRPTLTH